MSAGRWRAPSVSALALLALALACRKETKPPAPPDAAARRTRPVRPAPSYPPAPVVGEPERMRGKAIVVQHCLGCHSDDMLAQQRLTLVQWTKVVKTMRAWGSSLGPLDEDLVARYLASIHHPVAGAHAAPYIDSAAAAQMHQPLPDGPFAGGGAARGAVVYRTACERCHGRAGEGVQVLGTRLAGRLILWRAPEFARVVREGRGLMAASPKMGNAEVGAVLAHLRTLKGETPAPASESAGKPRMP